MIYEIQCKNDMLTGSVLIVKIPEEDLDRKALYTVREDMPGFILPFHHRIVDRQIEFVYQIGNESKLHYLAGIRSPNEYSELWTSLLSPLLDCGDWFLKPYSFVLDINFLFCDKNENSLKYVYIPSLRDCSDYGDLKAMAADFSRQISVTSADLENKALRAIMMDFNPKSFLQMLKANTAVSQHIEYIPSEARPYMYESRALPMSGSVIANQMDSGMPANQTPHPQTSMQGSSEDIIVDIPDGNYSERRNGKKSKNNDAKSRKNVKQANTRKGAEPPPIREHEAQRDETIGTGLTLNTAPVVSNPPRVSVDTRNSEPDDITQSISCETAGTWLRFIGSSSLPAGIDVAIGEGEVFTVGRYDTAAGRKLSSFEFDRMTKAVSRRHAAIERLSDGYSIIDLASSAGTYINGQKLPPNTPFKLQPGCRVSFGNCGADYVWEQ